VNTAEIKSEEKALKIKAKDVKNYIVWCRSRNVAISC
jgi:hypothetical protein